MEYRTGFRLWRGSAGDFSGWAADGDSDGGVLSPVVEPPFPCLECIPSWNADTPPGSWLEFYLRARQEGVWTRWYELGFWSSGPEPKRRSVPGQKDGTGEVATDTLRLSTPAQAFQARVRLRSGDAFAAPRLRSFALAYSAARPAAPVPARDVSLGLRGRVLADVPRRSQMVFTDGGASWCSPVSVSMVLGYWKGGAYPSPQDIHAAVSGVYDEAYKGHGNWPFNTAYAAREGREAYVARFSRLGDLEPWIVSGVPPVLSVAWNNAEGRPLSGAPMEKSRGHLTVLVGFDRDGNPVMNEPASASDAEVRRTYKRAELESRWLEASGGAAYLIFPEGRLVPAFPG